MRGLFCSAMLLVLVADFAPGQTPAPALSPEAQAVQQELIQVRSEVRRKKVEVEILRERLKKDVVAGNVAAISLEEVRDLKEAVKKLTDLLEKRK